MQPFSSTAILNQVRAERQLFIQRKAFIPQTDPVIMASWQRSAPRLNPHGRPQWHYLHAEHFTRVSERLSLLCTLAQPILEDVYQFTEYADPVICLTDASLCLLEMFGSPLLMTDLLAMGFRKGAFLTEGRLGSNAFAVSQLEGQPIWVCGPEHFLQYFHSLSAAAAPIHDSQGRLIGVIGVWERLSQSSVHTLGLAAMAARTIESRLQTEMLAQEANAHSTQLNAVLDAMSEGVITWNAEGRITHLNARAGLLLGLRPAAVMGRPLMEFISLPKSLLRAITMEEEVSDVEAELLIEGRALHHIVSVRIIRDPASDSAAHFVATLRPIAQVHRLVSRLTGSQAYLTMSDLIGVSKAAHQVRRQAAAAAHAHAPVLIIGESGTGKNTLARVIHNSSSRADGPFVPINCRAIPRDLVLAEFLGFEAGGFHGDRQQGQPSKFEMASGGTLFLEEIEALPQEMQIALLRVIETGSVLRLGGGRMIPVDVRVLASTVLLPDSEAVHESLRPDLLFRLSAFSIAIPPLRRRTEDIPVFADHLLNKLSRQMKRSLTLSQEVIDVLLRYPWPGNIREVETVIERAALASESGPILLGHLPKEVRERRVVASGPLLHTEPVYSLVEMEREAILKAGRAAAGNLSRTAAILGIGRTTLWRKMREMHLTIEDFA